MLRSPDVWEALLHSGQHGMPQGALTRNLGKMTQIGLLAPMADGRQRGNHAAHRRGRDPAGARATT